MSSKLWAVIPAAGQGSRFSKTALKQYIEIDGKTVLEHSINALYQLPLAGCVVAISAQDNVARDIDFMHPVQFCVGGKERMDSVLSALNFLGNQAQPDDYILVHDAARPCLHIQQIQLIQEFCDTGDVAAIVAIPVRDTIKRANVNQLIDATISREHLWQAQTPQIVKYAVLLDCLNKIKQDNLLVTDEASALEHYSYQIKLLAGRSDNIKITYSEDIVLVDALLRAKNMS